MTGEPSQVNSTPNVTVIGTGTMGSALVRALLATGCHVTVWNRTRARTAALESAGAAVAASPAAAVGESGIVIVCVSDQTAAAEVLSDGAVSEGLRGKTLIQMTTGTPADGRRGAAWAEPLGIGYVDTAILAYPREIGSSAAEIFYCGPTAASPDVTATLEAFGTIRYVGEDAGRAAAVDAALIAFFYGTMAGFLQCVTLAAAEGVGINDLLEISGPFFARFIANAVTETGERIAQERYGEPQSSMDTHLGGIDLLVLGSSRDAGIDVTVVTAIRDLFTTAIAAGRGGDDIAVLAELLRPKAGTGSS
jgi:3-hydroxyisobutyrate dehydrogenase-like beta-hydroxyacid dehydrogenase